jgi:hypothetical protein
MVLNGAIAQAAPDLQVGSDSSGEIDRDAFDLSTGANPNSFNIPMPRGVIQPTQVGVAQPISPDQLAPNSLGFRHKKSQE